MKLKHVLQETTRVSREKWKELAMQHYAKLWPGIEKALLAQAGTGERTMTVEFPRLGDTPEIVTRLVAVLLQSQLECEGLAARVLRPDTGTKLPWETKRAQYAVEVTW